MTLLSLDGFLWGVAARLPEVHVGAEWLLKAIPFLHRFFFFKVRTIRSLNRYAQIKNI